MSVFALVHMHLDHWLHSLILSLALIMYYQEAFGWIDEYTLLKTVVKCCITLVFGLQKDSDCLGMKSRCMLIFQAVKKLCRDAPCEMSLLVALSYKIYVQHYNAPNADMKCSNHKQMTTPSQKRNFVVPYLHFMSTRCACDLELTVCLASKLCSCLFLQSFTRIVDLEEQFRGPWILAPTSNNG